MGEISHKEILDADGRVRRIELKRGTDTRKPASSAGFLNVRKRVLFLVAGLLAGMLAAATLLGGLAGFARHWVGLSGFVSRLGLVGLVLLCHRTSPCQQALHRARTTGADRQLD